MPVAHQSPAAIIGQHQLSALAPQQFHVGHSCLRSIYFYFRLDQYNPVASRGDAHVGLDGQT
jgi:hypothetical protein